MESATQDSSIEELEDYIEEVSESPEVKPKTQVEEKIEDQIKQDSYFKITYLPAQDINSSRDKFYTEPQNTKSQNIKKRIPNSEFYENFEETMEIVLEQLKTTDKNKPNYFRIVENAYESNMTDVKEQKDHIKGEIVQLNEEMLKLKEKKKEMKEALKILKSMKETYHDQYKEYMFHSNETCREKRYVVDKYEEIKKNSLQYIPFELLVQYYQKRFPGNRKQFHKNKTNRKILTNDLFQKACRNCLRISHETQYCTYK